MNPANLQLEGLYAAVAALMDALREKGVLSAQELETALGAAEDKITSDPARRPGLSGASIGDDAVGYGRDSLFRSKNRPSVPVPISPG
jgi:hypothetical protein